MSTYDAALVQPLVDKIVDLITEFSVTNEETLRRLDLALADLAEPYVPTPHKVAAMRFAKLVYETRRYW